MLDHIDHKVIEIIAKKKKLDPARVTLDTTFAELGVDSLDAIDLLFTFEDTFNVSVPDHAAQQVKTVRDVAEALHAVLAGRAAEAN